MGLMDAANGAGKAIKDKRELDKTVEAAKEEAKDEAQAKLAQHEENKKQGMI